VKAVWWGLGIDWFFGFVRGFGVWEAFGGGQVLVFFVGFWGIFFGGESVLGFGEEGCGRGSLSVGAVIGGRWSRGGGWEGGGDFGGFVILGCWLLWFVGVFGWLGRVWECWGMRWASAQGLCGNWTGMRWDVGGEGVGF